jgi:hypothetical protein
MPYNIVIVHDSAEGFVFILLRVSHVTTPLSKKSRSLVKNEQDLDVITY